MCWQAQKNEIIRAKIVQNLIYITIWGRSGNLPINITWHPIATFAKRECELKSITSAQYQNVKWLWMCGFCIEWWYRFYNFKTFQHISRRGHRTAKSISWKKNWNLGRAHTLTHMPVDNWLSFRILSFPVTVTVTSKQWKNSFLWCLHYETAISTVTKKKNTFFSCYSMRSFSLWFFFSRFLFAWNEDYYDFIGIYPNEPAWWHHVLPHRNF